MRDGTIEKFSVNLTPLRAVALSAVLSACAYQKPYDTIPPRQEPLSSSWSGGTCALSGSDLVYSGNGSRSKIRLDVRPPYPSRIICGLEFTVILSEPEAVIALGGRSVLGGIEMLGSVGGEFTPANSYSLNISEPATERILSARLLRNELAIETSAGNSWRIDLTDPREWRIY
jgi:hypothetical protein